MDGDRGRWVAGEEAHANMTRFFAARIDGCDLRGRFPAPPPPPFEYRDDAGR